MRNYVTSTLSNSVRFTNWTRPTDQHMPPEVIGKPVLIKGGANLATDPHTERGRFTPRGISTEVSDEQLEYLMANNHFKNFMKNGLIEVVSESDAEKVSKDMEAKDKAAPLTDDDPHFKGEEKDGVLPIKPMTADTIVPKMVNKLTGKKD